MPRDDRDGDELVAWDLIIPRADHQRADDDGDFDELETDELISIGLRAELEQECAEQAARDELITRYLDAPLSQVARVLDLDVSTPERARMAAALLRRRGWLGDDY